MLLFSPYRAWVTLGLNNKFTVPLCYYFFKVGLCVLKYKTNKVVHKLQPWSWSWEPCQGWSSLYPFQNLFYVFLLVMRICQCSKWKFLVWFFFVLWLSISFIVYVPYGFHIKLIRAGKMAHWLKVYTALAEAFEFISQNSNPETHKCL